MNAPSELFDYFLLQPSLFVVPIEVLSPAGMTAEFGQEVVRRSLLTPEGVDLFNAALALYHERARGLYERSPAYWLPPRLQHVGVATEPVRPYFQPFHRSSWLLESGDFDPATSSVEFAAYQFANAERMAFLGQVAPALTANLSWFLVLDDREIADFVAGCGRTARQDAAGYVALAAAMPAVQGLYHVDLKPPVIVQPNVADLPGGLVATATGQAQLERLERSWSDAALDAVRRHRERHATRSGVAGERIGSFLSDSKPALVITAGEGRILWHPGSAHETELVREHLAAVTESAAESILEDLATVDSSTRSFLECVRDPSALHDPAPYITAGGLSYIERTHKLVAYDIGPGENEHRFWEPSPPYERLMLGARTVHEWGHLAAESGWIGVPQERKKERTALLRQLAENLDQLRASAPRHVQQGVALEVARHSADGRGLGQAIVRSLRQRIEDYQANLLARRILDPDAMETYVRNNVASRAGEYGMAHVYHELTRAVYEMQYLRLGRIDEPVDWFIRSTWFEERFVQPGIVSRAQFIQMAQLLASVCDMYVFDTEHLDLTRHADRPLVPLT